MSSYRIAAIDPGVHGAIAVLGIDGRILRKISMPLETNRKDIDIYVLKNLLKELQTESNGCLIIGVEKNCGDDPSHQYHPFKTGYNNGIAIGVVAAIGIPHRLLWPSVWQKPFHAGLGDKVAFPGTDTRRKAKIKSEKAARQRWPEDNLRPDLSTQYARKSHDGVVDALLMAEYIRINEFGGRLGYENS